MPLKALKFCCGVCDRDVGNIFGGWRGDAPILSSLCLDLFDGTNGLVL